MVDSVKDGIERALKENYAFICDVEVMNYLVMSKKCSHVGIKKSVLNAIVAYPANKKWPYMKLMDYL